ncbi:unnamed protein product [Absidia cylindrospora]
MLYTGAGPGKKPYRYVLLENLTTKTIEDFEPFERPAIIQSDRTFNEVYNRPWNKLSLPALPKVYDFELGPDTAKNKEHEKQDLGHSKLYEDGVVANLMFEFDPSELEMLHADKMNLLKKIKGKMHYVSYDHVQHFDKVSLKIGGHSSRTWAKVPYKLKLKSSDGLYDRWHLKLRPEATDPTMIREKLYSDVLQASGVLAPRGAYARIYFNGRPVGLYLLVDDTVDKSYLRETIHYGSNKANIGPVIKGDAGKGDYAADLAYRGDTADSYDELVYKVKAGKKNAESETADAMAALIDLTRFIANFNSSTAPKGQAVFEQWNKFIDVKHFIRQAACEWLGGNWDGIVYSGNNYMLYKHPKTNQFITIPMDFDFTFGNGLEGDQRRLMTGKWVDFSAQRMVHSYLWEKVISVPYFQQMYLDILNTINSKVTRPDVILPRVQALAYMIQHDAEWDKGLERWTSGGLSRQWANGAFLQSLDRGAGAEDENIGVTEWIRQKYRAVTEDVASIQTLGTQEKDAQMQANAISIKGIPRDIFEEMEDAAEEQNDD